MQIVTYFVPDLQNVRIMCEFSYNQWLKMNVVQ